MNEKNDTGGRQRTMLRPDIIDELQRLAKLCHHMNPVQLRSSLDDIATRAAESRRVPVSPVSSSPLRGLRAPGAPGSKRERIANAEAWIRQLCGRIEALEEEHDAEDEGLDSLSRQLDETQRGCGEAFEDIRRRLEHLEAKL